MSEPVWGHQTDLAIRNFPISGEPVDRRLIAAVALIKRHAALVNGRARSVDAVDVATAAAIAAAAEEVEDGMWSDQFPVDVFQTGSGTSTNMNVNEVLASLASDRLGESVHPNDQVNASQSSNDVMPSAIRIATLDCATNDLLPSLSHLAAILEKRSRSFSGAVKAGRTHLMDAVPVTLGQEFAAYASQVRAAAAAIEVSLPALGELPLGGTAVGTGLNAPRDFGAKVISAIADESGLRVTAASNRFAAQGSQDALVGLSGQLRLTAVALNKIANDVRLMASGPAAGLGEIRLPELQPGSSIMPGKVNPVIPEVVTQVAAQVIGNDAAVGFAGAQGTFELNTYLPVMARNLLESLRLLSTSSRVFADSCIAGIEADEAAMLAHAKASPALATALNLHIGYDRAAAVVKEARATGRSLEEVVVDKGWMSATEAAAALDPRKMT
jgi:fumarate hydratase class II